MTTQTVGTRRPASLPGGITGYAGQPVTWSSSRTSMTPPITAGSGSKSSPRAAQDAFSRSPGGDPARWSGEL